MSGRYASYWNAFLLNVYFYYHQYNGEKIGPSAILSVIHTITIGTMLNFSDDINGHKRKNVACKQKYRCKRTRCMWEPIVLRNPTEREISHNPIIPDLQLNT